MFDLMSGETRLLRRRVGSAIGAVPSRRPVATLIEPSFNEPYVRDVLLCFFVSAKSFLDGSILRVNANAVPRAFRLGRELTDRIAALGILRGETLRLGVNRAPSGVEFLASIDRLVVSSRAPQSRVVGTSRLSGG